MPNSLILAEDRQLPSSSNSSVSTEVGDYARGRFPLLANRRKFLGLAAGAAGALGLAGCNDPAGPAAPPNTSLVDTLNFALNLEYLEASFYLYVTTGTGLSATDMGTGAGTVTGGAQVTFTNATVTTLAKQLALHEQQHVEYLRTAIVNAGGSPVPMPSLNLAALGPVTSDATFLAIARQLETIGLSAYIGATSVLAGNMAAVGWAAQILDTEAQHEGYLRMLCSVMSITSAAVDSADQPPSLSAVFNTDKTSGLTTARTPSQVLQLVYGAAGKTGVSSGGFFPSGLNGNIKTS